MGPRELISKGSRIAFFLLCGDANRGSVKTSDGQSDCPHTGHVRVPTEGPHNCIPIESLIGPRGRYELDSEVPSGSAVGAWAAVGRLRAI